MRPDNIIKCPTCNGVEVVVMIMMSLDTMKPYTFHSCGSCSGAPNYRILLGPEHFDERLSLVTSLLDRHSTPEEIAAQFTSLFEKLGERMKSKFFKHGYNQG